MVNNNVLETDVVIATAKWLKSNGWEILNISIPTREIEHKPRLIAEFETSKIPIDLEMFRASGPDIIAQRNNVKWKIECKGLSSGEEPTKRAKFSLALASAVSYFDGSKDTWIGIALPDYDTYRNLVSIKISQALRKKLDLWIMFYNQKNNSIEEIINPDNIFNFARKPTIDGFIQLMSDYYKTKNQK